MKNYSIEMENDKLNSELFQSKQTIRSHSRKIADLEKKLYFRKNEFREI